MHPRRASIAAVSGLLAAARYLTIVPFPGPGHAPAETLGRHVLGRPASVKAVLVRRKGAVSAVLRAIAGAA